MLIVWGSGGGGVSQCANPVGSGYNVQIFKVKSPIVFRDSMLTLPIISETG